MKITKKIIAYSVMAGMIISSGCFPANVSADVNNGEKDTYIVLMENEETLEKVSEKYSEQVSDGSNEYSNLEKENCVVLDLTKSQAESLSYTSGVEFVETDETVCGAAVDMEKVSDCDTEWNLNMVNADSKENATEDTNKAKPIKVAIIDSGIDYTNGINVAKRKNFIPDEDDINILYEDASGHGTSVAGIIAASGEKNADINGIAKNVELYSAKVLDSGNKAPISRVVEGIYWAIEQGVDIINLSLGTSKPSELLEKAVKDAYDKGILLIASAGNNEKNGVTDEKKISNRYDCAKEIAKNILNHITETNYISSVTTGSVSDWVISSNIYNGSFKLVGFSEYAKAANNTVYTAKKKNFDDMNLNISDIVEY